MSHEDFMNIALSLAKEAKAAGEVPVGCVITDAEGNIVGTGRNRREETGLVSSHAEVIAIDEACRTLGDWRLSDCTLYVTLEPCPMCAGAILNARIGRIYYGAKDERLGSCGSVINLFMENYGFSPKIIGSMLADECSYVLRSFFESLR